MVIDGILFSMVHPTCTCFAESARLSRVNVSKICVKVRKSITTLKSTTINISYICADVTD